MRRAAEYGRGMRILRQDLWEILISFLISQNDDIPRIRTSSQRTLRSRRKDEVPRTRRR